MHSVICCRHRWIINNCHSTGGGLHILVMRDEYNISVATLPLFTRSLNALGDSRNDSRNYWAGHGALARQTWIEELGKSATSIFPLWELSSARSKEIIRATSENCVTEFADCADSFHRLLNKLRFKNMLHYYIPVHNLPSHVLQVLPALIIIPIESPFGFRVLLFQGTYTIFHRIAPRSIHPRELQNSISKCCATVGATRV